MSVKNRIPHDKNEFRKLIIPLAAPKKRRLKKDFLVHFDVEPTNRSFWTNRFGGIVQASDEELKFVKGFIDGRISVTPTANTCSNIGSPYSRTLTFL